MLCSASLSGKPLDWKSSTTIDNVLIKKHVPPLAQWVRGANVSPPAACARRGDAALAQ